MTQYCLSHNDINHVGYVHGDHDAALGPVVALLSESKQIGHNADNGKYDQVIDREDTYRDRMNGSGCTKDQKNVAYIGSDHIAQSQIVFSFSGSYN